MPGSTEFYCPDLSGLPNNELEIQGDPYFNGGGKNFNFVVAPCSTAIEKLGGSQSDCLDLNVPSDTKQKVEKIRVIYKFVSQYFNTNKYVETGQGLFNDSSEMSSIQLLFNLSQMTRYTLVQENYTVFSNKILSLA